VEWWEDKKGKESILPQKKKLAQESQENEKNRSPDPDSNKTKTKYDKEPNEAHKNTLKE
jgi:hypothetical protein